MKLAYVHKYTFSFLVWTSPLQSTKSLQVSSSGCSTHYLLGLFFAPIQKKKKLLKKTWDGQNNTNLKKKNNNKDLGCLPFSFFSMEPEKTEKISPPERFSCKKHGGAFHSLQYAGEKG